MAVGWRSCGQRKRLFCISFVDWGYPNSINLFKMNAFILFLIAFGMDFSSPEPARKHSVTNVMDYRAVKYSKPIDYLTAHDIMGYSDPNPGDIPIYVTAYKYYIQYGSDMVITILDPGIGMEFMGIFIKKWDFANRKTELTHYMDQVGKYSVTIDSIPFAIEDSRGQISSLCSGVTPQSECDSVKIVSYSGDAEYTVKLIDTIPNITSQSLFYPDIKYLPAKIFGLGYDNATLSLEEIIYGKSAVDSLLNLFTFENYSLITEEDRSQISDQEVIDLMEEFDQATKKKH